MYVYVSKETGEVVNYKTMIEMWKDQYDGGDDTNPLGWTEYFDRVKVPADFWD